MAQRAAQTGAPEARDSRTRARAARLVALSLWALVVALDVVLVAPYQLDWYGLTHPYDADTFRFGEALTSVVFVLVVPAYVTLGAAIVALRPANAIGWLCFVPGLLMVAVGWSPGLGTVADAMQNLAWNLMVPPLPITLMLFIFPDGRLLSRRWWAVMVVASAGYVLMALDVYAPGVYVTTGLPEAAGLWVCLAAPLASSVSVVLRWRRGRAQERRQLKWLAYVVVLTVVAVIGMIGSRYAGGANSLVSVLLVTAAVFGVGLGIPAAVGVAILRHRLYDIDVVINRTLVYGSLTAILAGVYFVGVAVAQAVFGGLTRQGDLPQLVIVASTLAVAALFNPLRRRLQGFVDRRFYRRKYDAAKTLEAYSSRLRDETDLNRLGGEMVGVV
jgi:hypothetical protein